MDTNKELAMSLYHRSLGLVLLAACCVPLGAVAEEKGADEIAKCDAETSSVKRLECYDAANKKRKEAIVTASKWRVSKETSRMDDTTTVSLSLDADTKITGTPNKVFTPTLILRCKKGKSDAYIITGMAPQAEKGKQGTTVTIRLDKDKSSQYVMGKSKDGTALFFENSPAFIKKLQGHTTMLFEFTPANSPAAMTSFDLTGIDVASEPLRQSCKL